MTEYRTAKDTLGEVQVPKEAYYGAQTQRAVENFPISGQRLPFAFVKAQAIIKASAAAANRDCGELDEKKANAIIQAAEEVMEGKLADQFVVDAYQAGAGTSQNMNANEVIASRASELLGGEKGDWSNVHPNDHVNMAQSTNDTIHVAINISTTQELYANLYPALEETIVALRKKQEEFHDIIRSGRTHLQDAVPMRLGQSFGGYAESLQKCMMRLSKASPSCLKSAWEETQSAQESMRIPIIVKRQLTKWQRAPVFRLHSQPTASVLCKIMARRSRSAGI